MIHTLISQGNNKEILKHNNEFDISLVKWMYIIENLDTFFIRFWQGNKIE